MGCIKVGITGQEGFVGTHLYNFLGLQESVKRIPFSKEFFSNQKDLSAFVRQCDVIIHLAGMNRHKDPQIIYDTNISLVRNLISACEGQEATPHILFSSSTQEEKGNLYGKSKKDGRLALEAWARRSGALVTGLVIPNVFGPFGKPFYNSVVATFCYQLTHGEQPTVINDSALQLIYVNELVEEILSVIKNPDKVKERNSEDSKYFVQPTKVTTVSAVYTLLNSYREDYLHQGIFPDLSNAFEKALFNTFRCYVPAEYYPKLYKLNTDNRGTFVELARTNTSGQTSYSTTPPGITRGNHFHTRKAERFAIIQGKAKIQLRKIGTIAVIDYYLDGATPSYVDMPIWHTHNITNIGDDDLVTVFWINEPFDPADPDTYFEAV